MMLAGQPLLRNGTDPQTWITTFCLASLLDPTSHAPRLFIPEKRQDVGQSQEQGRTCADRIEKECEGVKAGGWVGPA